MKIEDCEYSGRFLISMKCIYISFVVTGTTSAIFVSVKTLSPWQTKYSDTVDGHMH